MSSPDSKPAFTRCAYIGTCYIAEASRCHGYKKDCPLYRDSNGERVREYDFHKAMDNLINTTRSNHLEKSKIS